MDNSRKAGRQAQTAPVAARRAFEGYLRWGRAAHAGTELKAVGRELSVKAVGDARPTNYYTWRTAHDERVRPAHAVNEGRVFAWSDPPPTGHPGHEPNCRCTAEPYYGTPFVSDASLLLKREARVDATGQAVWRNIDTLTRPDGSLAQSTILMRDGTTIRSTFNGQLVVNNVTVPDGPMVRLVRNDGVQSVLVGESQTPVVQSVWTADGPKVVGPRTRVAFSGSPFALSPMNLRVEVDNDILGRRDSLGLLEDPDPNGPLTPDLAAGGAAIGLALLALFLASQADRASVGAGTEDQPALTIRIWTPNGKLTPIPVSVTSLTAEQVTQTCKRLPEVQMWTDLAALNRGPRPAGVSPATWGTWLHDDVDKMFKSLKEQYPLTYADTWSERSFTPKADDAVRSSAGSSRLDIVEIRDEAVCIYDIKTGDSDMQRSQIVKYSILAAAFGKVTFYIIQVKPSVKFQESLP